MGSMPSLFAERLDLNRDGRTDLPGRLPMTSTSTPPKYSLAEIERRWLLALAEAGPLDGYPCSVIEDRYLAGTGLRLRKVVGVDGAPIFKFCKKYGRGAGLAEPITNLYLSQAEYDILSQLGGMPVRKRRYAIDGG